MRNRILGATALTMLVFAAGCGAEGDANAASAAPGDAAQPTNTALAPSVLTVTAGDFFFTAPSTTPAGLTTIRLVNQGPELHHVQLVRLEPGHTMKELIDQVSAGGKVPEWAREVGGPNTPVPGGQSEATVDLQAGEYAIVCVIPSADGTPHFMKGMAVPLTVTPSARSAGAEPAADVRMTLTDYSFNFDQIRSGRRTIRVENQAEQPHELILVQLAPGKTVHDMMSWLEKMDGPPPGAPVGGTTAMAKGEVNYVTADFAPGEYALLCMIPDAADGKPHIAHGMARQITVQ